LLDPYEVEDCGELSVHMQYVFEELDSELVPTGMVEGISDRGRMSVQIYDLNRQPLWQERRDRQRAAIDSLKAALLQPEQFKKRLREWFDDEQVYASAVRAACRAWIQHLKRQLERAESVAGIAPGAPFSGVGVTMH
jgi:hypothetical protein